MNLFETLKQDRIQAMKDGYMTKKNLLGVLIGDCSRETKEPEDIKVIAMIKKFIANSQQVLEMMAKMSKVADPKIKTEIDILESYLPRQLDEETIRNIFELNQFANIGKAMGYFRNNYSGQYDGSLVSKIATKLLQT